MQKLGSDNIDCRSSSLNVDASDRASYTFNTTIAGIEKADSCLLIGVNPRKTSPIINLGEKTQDLVSKSQVTDAAPPSKVLATAQTKPPLIRGSITNSVGDFNFITEDRLYHIQNDLNEI